MGLFNIATSNGWHCAVCSLVTAASYLAVIVTEFFWLKVFQMNPSQVSIQLWSSSIIGGLFSSCPWTYIYKLILGWHRPVKVLRSSSYQVIGHLFTLILTIPWYQYHLYLAIFTQFDQEFMAIPHQCRTTWLLSSTLVTAVLSEYRCFSSSISSPVAYCRILNGIYFVLG